MKVSAKTTPVKKKKSRVRLTHAGEVMTYQVNDPPLHGHGVNRYNKDGYLILGDDGTYLRNVKVMPGGEVVVKQIEPVKVILPRVKGEVEITNAVTVKPVEITNMPDPVTIPGQFDVAQLPREAKVEPFGFSGYIFEIPFPIKLYSVYFTTPIKTEITVEGITGAMFIDEFKLNLFPLYLSLPYFKIMAREHVTVGGYIIHEG